MIYRFGTSSDARFLSMIQRGEIRGERDIKIAKRDRKGNKV